ncbi:MAG TPA: hypothetical protein GX517_04500 [Alicyclobacillus sp.]|nr:hypothetical protein [Alicyclobacillus sp.]
MVGRDEDKELVFRFVDALVEANQKHREIGQEVVQVKCPACGGAITVRYGRTSEHGRLRGYCDKCDFAVMS